MSRLQRNGLENALDRILGAIHPDLQVERVFPLGQDETEEGEATEKGIGYGVSLQVVARSPSGERRAFVFHTLSANNFDHDRRSDRAKLALLSYDTFGEIPLHVPAVDVGAIRDSGELVSLRDTGEFYVLTGFLPGEVYAGDLRRAAANRELSSRDLRRAETLARYLADLHSSKVDRPPAYTRSLRNVVGDGEGVFGLVDNYPANVEAAPPQRLQSIEASCVEWRWKLRGRERRLSRIHGDFHPFNILFDGQDQPGMLDASRGCLGDPADDATCLAINYLFFALEHEGAWPALGELWRLFWEIYLRETGDLEVLETAPPFFAWRALVLANPVWYPETHAEVRDRLLTLVERTLTQERLNPDDAEGLFH